MSYENPLRINRATEEDIPFIIAAYKWLVGERAEIISDLTAEKIKADVLTKEPTAYIYLLVAGTKTIGFVYYAVVDDSPREQNISIHTLCIDTSPEVNQSSVGRTVLNYIFSQHKGIDGILARTEHASKAIQAVTLQEDVDYRFNAYTPQSAGSENRQILKVRIATKEDIPFIIQGNQIIDQKSYVDAPPPNPLNEARLERDVFSPDNPRAHILIAEVNGHRAGFVMYSYCYFASEGEGIWLTNFFIDPTNRKEGVGKAMIEYMKTLYPNVSGVYGAIASTNSMARHFFSGTGAMRYTDYIIYGTENDWGVVS